MNELYKMVKEIEGIVVHTSHQIGKNALSPKVLKAMERVPRDEFVPTDAKRYAFYNGPLAIGHGQTISQPYIVALMTDLLEPHPEDSILEIGTGSAYQSAVLSLLVKQVYSMEIIDDLAVEAKKRLNRLGYANVEVLSADGYYGWPEHAPYDGIIVTAAAPVVPAPLVGQLKPGGKLVIPVGNPYAYQELMVVGKKQDGGVETRNVLSVSFVPLTGEGLSQP